MYMFFWFFKQLYYCLKRIFKSGILLLILFFIVFLFLFQHKIFAATLYTKKCELCDITYDTYSYPINTLGNSPGKHLVNILISSYNNKIYAVLWFSYNQNDHNFSMYMNNNYPYQSGYNTDIYELQNNTFVYLGWDGINFDRNNYKSIVTDGTYIYSGKDIYTDNTLTTIYFSSKQPQILTSSSSISNLTFTNLEITGQGVIPNSYAELVIYYNNNTYYIDLSQYTTLQHNTPYFSVPKSVIINNFVARDGYNLAFDLYTRQPVERWFSSSCISFK